MARREIAAVKGVPEREFQGRVGVENVGDCRRQIRYAFDLRSVFQDAEFDGGVTPHPFELGGKKQLRCQAVADFPVEEPLVSRVSLDFVVACSNPVPRVEIRIDGERPE